MGDKKSSKPVFKHIPEYDLKDPLNERLITLVRLEQFLTEKTITREIIEDLKTIRKLAQKAGESRIATISDLIINHSRKYFLSPNKTD